MDDHPDRTWNPTWSRNSWTSGCVFVKADAERIKISMQSRQTTPRPLTHTNTPPPLLLMLLPAISVFIIIFHASSCSDEQQGVIYTALNLCYFYSFRVSKNKQTRKQKSWALMSELNFPSEVKGFWLCEFLRFSCMNFKGLTTDFQWMLGGLGELNTRQKLQFFPLEETDCEFLTCA